MEERLTDHLLDVEIINTDNISETTKDENMYISRQKASCGYEFDASIIVMAYNRLEKTKKCVECIITYTNNINYELILVDNGSNDNTLEFFKGINYVNKRVYSVTKNIGVGYPQEIAMNHAKGKYIVVVPNDVYVTTNWLSNLLKCYESDPKIGFANPMSSNVSNLQEVNFEYNTLDEMQEQAAKFNVSDPYKWEERMRVISIITIIRREMLNIVGKFDTAFLHDFSEDDYAVRVRRAGYKVILCGDTYVHHDHDFRNPKEKDPVLMKKSIDIGRKIYSEKYNGIDAWNDILNFERPLINMINTVQNSGVNILGIDIKCGTPLLEIRNKLKRDYRIINAYTEAFTSDVKYYQDLLTVANKVYCDQIERVDEYFVSESFDFVILGEHLNVYPNFVRLLQKLIELTKKDGNILFKVKNVADVFLLLKVLGMTDEKVSLNEEMAVAIDINEFAQCIGLMGVSKVNIITNKHNVTMDTYELIKKNIFNSNFLNQYEEAIDQLLIGEYLICITK